MKSHLLTNVNRISIIGGLLLLAVCYQFSFKKSIDAISLHQSLLNKVEDGAIGTQTTKMVLERKHEAYQKILKTYQVKGADRQTFLWQTVSGMAIQKGVDISFNPLQTVVDTLDASYPKERYTFSGNYKNLVGLLDTLHKTNKIGKIASLTIRRVKADVPDKTLKMTVWLVGTER